jgi:hypothetical protein
MAKSTKLILADSIYITEIGHRRSTNAEAPPDIGHRRSVSTEEPPEIGHHRAVEDTDRFRSTSDGTAVLELSEAQFVRRVRAYRDPAGNIHLELEE